MMRAMRVQRGKTWAARSSSQVSKKLAEICWKLDGAEECDVPRGVGLREVSSLTACWRRESLLGGGGRIVGGIAGEAALAGAGADGREQAEE